jgi:hypothetical protein
VRCHPPEATPFLAPTTHWVVTHCATLSHRQHLEGLMLWNTQAGPTKCGPRSQTANHACTAGTSWQCTMPASTPPSQRQSQLHHPSRTWPECLLLLLLLLLLLHSLARPPPHPPAWQCVLPVMGHQPLTQQPHVAVQSGTMEYQAISCMSQVCNCSGDRRRCAGHHNTHHVKVPGAGNCPPAAMVLRHSGTCS